MDRVKAKAILQAYGHPTVKTWNTIISSARQTEVDLDKIESKPDKDLIDEWKSLVFVNEIYGQVSLNDMQLIALIELEFESRKTIVIDELKLWFEQQSTYFDNDYSEEV